MSFKIDCPHCKRTLNVTEPAFGTTVPCPGCNRPIQVPHPAQASCEASRVDTAPSPPSAALYQLPEMLAAQARAAVGATQAERPATTLAPAQVEAPPPAPPAVADYPAEAKESKHRIPASQAALVAVLVIAAGIGGWMIGRYPAWTRGKESERGPFLPPGPTSTAIARATPQAPSQTDARAPTDDVAANEEAPPAEDPRPKPAMKATRLAARGVETAKKPSRPPDASLPPKVPDADEEDSPAVEATADRITFPSGEVLAQADLDSVTAQAKNAARQLLDARVQCTPDSACLGFGPSLVFYRFTPKRPVGPAIFFWPDKDPLTCWQNRLDASEDHSPKARLFWTDVAIQCYAEYKNGKLHGRLASWNEDGEFQFLFNYANNKPHGLCCLFNQDQLRVVVECDRQGAAETVHLISAWKINKSIAVTESQADAAAVEALKQFRQIDLGLRKESHEFCKNHETMHQKLVVAPKTNTNRGRMLDNVARLNADKQQAFAAIQAIRDAAPASQRTVSSPSNNYVPVPW